MSVITSIKPQKNNKRVNIYLDGKFGFGIDLENFVKLGLKVEQSLEDEEIKKIIKKAEFQKTYDYLLKFAMLRPRSEKEIKDWFRRKKTPESLHQDLFSKLKGLDLIDDEKFAMWWVEQRLEFRNKSKRDLEYELRMKGIKKDIIDNVLSKIEINEEEIAKDLLRKKLYRWKLLPDTEKKRKISEFLARKGFGWDIIKKVT